jgi:hypothetical protein
VRCDRDGLLALNAAGTCQKEAQNRATTQAAETFVMRVFKGVDELPEDRESFLAGNRSARLDSFDQFEDDSAILNAVDGGDVGMVQGDEDLASRVKRARRSGSTARVSGRILTATSRFSLESVASQTSPMPPSPSLVVIR